VKWRVACSCAECGRSARNALFMPPARTYSTCTITSIFLYIDLKFAKSISQYFHLYLTNIVGFISYIIVKLYNYLLFLFIFNALYIHHMI